MDPDTTLEQLREAQAQLQEAYRRDDEQDINEALVTIAHKSWVLDGWISKGGFLPRAWAP